MDGSGISGYLRKGRCLLSAAREDQRAERPHQPPGSKSSPCSRHTDILSTPSSALSTRRQDVPRLYTLPTRRTEGHHAVCFARRRCSSPPSYPSSCPSSAHSTTWSPSRCCCATPPAPCPVNCSSRPGQPNPDFSNGSSQPAAWPARSQTHTSQTDPSLLCGWGGFANAIIVRRADVLGRRRAARSEARSNPVLHARVLRRFESVQALLEGERPDVSWLGTIAQEKWKVRRQQYLRLRHRPLVLTPPSARGCGSGASQPRRVAPRARWKPPRPVRQATVPVAGPRRRSRLGQPLGQGCYRPCGWRIW